MAVAVTGLHFVPTRYEDPVVAALIEGVQAEYVVRYGGPDETPVRPDEFAPPNGLFLVAWRDGEPVASGAWRTVDLPAFGPGTVEIKRMYVVPAARRQGISRAMLAELERTVVAAGHRRIVLESGVHQPEALALYRSSGYDTVSDFGHYVGSGTSVYFGKRLVTDGEEKVSNRPTGAY